MRYFIQETLVFFPCPLRDAWEKNNRDPIKLILKWILISILPVSCNKVVSSQVLLYE